MKYELDRDLLGWLLDISTPTGISVSGDRTITKEFAKEIVVTIKEQDNEILRLNKIIETKNKRIKKLEDNNKDLKAILKEYKYELGLQELESTSIVDLD